jgi:hypothetical protein
MAPARDLAWVEGDEVAALNHETGCAVVSAGRCGSSKIVRSRRTRCPRWHRAVWVGTWGWLASPAAAATSAATFRSACWCQNLRRLAACRRVSPQLAVAACRRVSPQLAVDPLRVEDADALAPVRGDALVHRFIGGTPPTPTELRARVERQVRGRSPDGNDVDGVWSMRAVLTRRAISGTGRRRSGWPRPTRRGPPGPPMGRSGGGGG